MRYNKHIGLVMMAAGMLAATSCTDFSDYNEVKADANPSAGQTLWENISQNPQLRNFAELVRETGFNEALNSPHYYTVWAPLDGTYNADSLRQLGDAAVLYRFVKSHVAEYSHNVSGPVDERIHALNEKSFQFTGTGAAYTYGGVELDQANLPSQNGVMHTLRGAAQFYPNIYEYIWMAEGIDSLAAYVKHYEKTYLDEEASVTGPTVNGVQTYIDSVMVTENDMVTHSLNAHLENEDSLYTFMMPTNKAWNDLYARMAPYYNYISPIAMQDLANASGSTAIPSVTRAFETAYMKDSVLKWNIVNNLVFNNNNYYNRWVEDAQQEFTDTIYTTTRHKLSNPRDILAPTIGKTVMSNGYSRIIDSVAIHPWESYARSIRVGCTSSYRARVLTGNTHNVSVTEIKPEMGDLQGAQLDYVWCQPTGTRVRPELDMFLPNVLSIPYNFYVVFVPKNIAVDDTTGVDMPNNVNFTLNYCTARGALADYNFSADMKVNPSKPVAFNNDPAKLDTVFIGQFTFPVAYAGIKDFYPNLKVTSDVTSASQRSKYTRDLRIAAVILRPVELDEYEESKQQ